MWIIFHFTAQLISFIWTEWEQQNKMIRRLIMKKIIDPNPRFEKMYTKILEIRFE